MGKDKVFTLPLSVTIGLGMDGRVPLLVRLLYYGIYV
ncbi:MAG: hypothetical protein RL285_1048 [Bacteroidota bacterium]|jgi:hypothetical protein